jgi:hypothetical protein
MDDEGRAGELAGELERDPTAGERNGEQAQ